MSSTTGDQRRSYRQYSGELSPAQLARYFHVDTADRELVDARRGAHNRLGFAVQLGTVRFLGAFLPDPTDVPEQVVAYVAAELDIEDPGVFKGYAQRRSTQWEHAEQIRRAYGYRDFSDPEVQAELAGWLAARARTSADQASVLVDLATARLVAAKVLLPGSSLLERLVATAREQAAQQLHAELAALPDEQQRERLAGLLTVDEVTRTSRLERLRRGPTSVTAAGLLGALDRLTEVRGLGVAQLDLSGVPAGRVATLARHAQTARAQALARMTEPRRTATLLAAARQLETDATDDLLDLLDRLLSGLLARSQRVEARNRLRELPALDVAARSLRDAVAVLLDPPDAGRGGLLALWAALEQRGMSRAQLTDAVDAVGELSRQPQSWAEQLLARYSHVRRFLPALLDGLQLRATAGGQPVLTALDALRDLQGRRQVPADQVPTELATGVWQRLVTTPDGQLDRRAYTFCVLERLRESLRRRDVFAPASSRWADPRARLLTGQAWDAAREQVCRSLGHDASPEREVGELTGELDAAYRGVAARLPDNTAVRVETAAGRDRPVLTALDRLEEPASLLALRELLAALLPRVDLPDLLLEVAGWTGFPAEFTHVLRRRQPRRRPAPVGLCGAHRRGLQHRPRTAHPSRPGRADPRPAVLGRAELPTRRHPHRRQHPPRGRPSRHLPGRRLGRWRGRQRRRAALRRPGPHPERRAQPPLLWTRPRRHLPELPLRPVLRLPRRRRPWHPARQPLHPPRPARAADDAAASRADDRHRRLHGHRLRPVPPARLPVQPPPRRPRRRPVLAHRTGRQLRVTERRRPQPSRHRADHHALG